MWEEIYSMLGPHGIIVYKKQILRKTQILSGSLEWHIYGVFMVLLRFLQTVFYTDGKLLEDVINEF